MTDDGTEFLPAGVLDLPPAARFVYRELDVSEPGELSVTALADQTGYGTRAIRRATTTLEDAGYAERRPAVDDPRERIVVLTDGD